MSLATPKTTYPPKAGQVNRWDGRQYEPSYLGANDLSLPIVTVAATYTIAYTDFTVLVDTSGGNLTVNLPATPRHGFLVNVKRISTLNTLTIGANGANIDGSGSDLSVSSGALTNTRLQYSSSYGWATL